MLIEEYVGSDIGTLPEYLYLYKEGEKGRVRIYLEETLLQEELEQIVQDLAGMTVEYDARILSIGFQRQSDPLTIIAASVTVGILGWQLFKEEGKGVALGLAALVGIAIVALLSSSRSNSSKRRR